LGEQDLVGRIIEEHFLWTPNEILDG